PAGIVSNHIGYFGDMMATAAELANVNPPSDLNSVSLVPTLTGITGRQAEHDHLYWEFYERGGCQAVRKGPWKAIRSPLATGTTQLFQLDDDLGEARDVSAAHIDIVRQLESLMDADHEPHPNWQPRGEPAPHPSPPGDGRPRF
ncbi:MAG: N-acetylgalactosamine-6-sulfatase, partial [Planctomycetaceae bacterium]|nr:N-acetylgalactosamine-6-sulfatase [Planctomycetaceae bacterium]